jgi:DegV family protein with EDD domain
VRLSTDNTAVVLDSTADLPDASERHSNWRTVHLYVRFGDEVFREYVELSAEEFYRRLRAAPEPPRSSQPSPADFEAAFADLGAYERIVCVLLPEQLSGTIKSARLAAEPLGDKVLVVDSGAISGGAALLADCIQRRLERGTTADEIDALIERFRRERGLLFTVDTLDYLVRGGRVGKAAGLAGQLLSVKPVLTITDGEVTPLKRVRGRTKALAALADIFEESTRDHPTLHVGVAHADAERDVEDLSTRIRAKRPRASFDLVTVLGPVIGTHGGPGTLGLFWYDDEL